VASFLLVEINKRNINAVVRFSSLSESGFIPTMRNSQTPVKSKSRVLISFREWLHSYGD